MSIHHISHRLRHLTPQKLAAARAHRKAIMKFADKMGLVYFGSTQRDDEDYRLVRGLTTSPHTLDAHYCIGTYEGYDTVFVERSAVNKAHHATVEGQHWLIMTFDLHTKAEIPHIFIGRREHSAAFYSQFFVKFTYMSPLGLTTIDGYDTKYLDMYATYCRITDAADTTRLFDPALTKIIGERFNGLTVEVVEGTLYIYAENEAPTAHVLDIMLRYGVWLAQTIDIKMSPELRPPEDQA